MNIYIWLYVYMYIYMNIYMYIYIHTHEYIYTHIYTHIFTHVCIICQYLYNIHIYNTRERDVGHRWTGYYPCSCTCIARLYCQYFGSSCLQGGKQLCVTLHGRWLLLAESSQTTHWLTVTTPGTRVKLLTTHTHTHTHIYIYTHRYILYDIWMYIQNVRMG